MQKALAWSTAFRRDSGRDDKNEGSGAIYVRFESAMTQVGTCQDGCIMCGSRTVKRNVMWRECCEMVAGVGDYAD